LDSSAILGGDIYVDVSRVHAAGCQEVVILQLLDALCTDRDPRQRAVELVAPPKVPGCFVMATLLQSCSGFRVVEDGLSMRKAVDTQPRKFLA
jgi:hypothetical protein